MSTRMGVISVRLGGLDGVSLEVDKWVKVLRKIGCKVFFCAGTVARSPMGYSQITGKSYPELENTKIIPGLSIESRNNKWITNSILKSSLSESGLKNLDEEIEFVASHLRGGLKKWIDDNKIEKIIIQNINALPLHIPAAVAISQLLDENPDLIAIFHHHDFYWERDYFLKNKNIKKYLKEYFPPKKKNALHITINTKAQKMLMKHHGIHSTVVPNIFDPHILKKDEYNKTFRKDIGISEDDVVFLAPVRIVPRKNLESAIDLVKKLNNPKIKLVIAGCVDSVDFSSRKYFEKLEKMCKPIRKNLKIICGKIGPRRREANGKKIYTLFDVYAHADFMVYPTAYEGWGNALGEAMAFRIPFLVNRYDIFKEDIEPLGVVGVKIDNGKITNKTIKEVKEIITNKKLQKKLVDKNYSIIQKHLDLEVLEKVLRKLDCCG